MLIANVDVRGRACGCDAVVIVVPRTPALCPPAGLQECLAASMSMESAGWTTDRTSQRRHTTGKESRSGNGTRGGQAAVRRLTGSRAIFMFCVVSLLLLAAPSSLSIRSMSAVRNEDGDLVGRFEGEDVIFPDLEPTLEWVLSTPVDMHL